MRQVIPLLSLFILLVLGACIPLDVGDKTGLTAEQALQNYEKLDGQEVRIEGVTSFVIAQTAQLCVPDTCDCNQTRGHIGFKGKTEGRHIQLSNGTTIWNEIDIEIECLGNQCSLTCSPFNPTTTDQLELVGRLTVCYDCSPISVRLEDIVTNRSRAHIEGKWVPLAEGEFVIPLGKGQ
jgi:hypothetical protein